MLLVFCTASLLLAHSLDCTAGVCAPDAAPELAPPIVTLTVEVPAHATGSDIHYRVTVTNRGETPAHHVVVSHAIPANARLVRATPEARQEAGMLLWFLGTLEPTERRVLQLVLKPSDQSNVAACFRVQLEHGACVVTKPSCLPASSGVEPKLPDTPKPPPPVASVTVNKLGLQIDAPAKQGLELPVAYRLTVANAGTGPLREIRLQVPLPVGTEYLSASDQGGLTADGGTIRWQLGHLGVNQARTVELKLRALQIGLITCRAQAFAQTETGETIRSPLAEAKTLVEGAAGLHIEVKDTADPIYVGEETVLRVLVRNQGQAVARDVSWRALLPPELFVTQIKPSRPINYEHQRGQSFVQTTTFDLAPGEAVVFEITAQAQRPGYVLTTVELSAPLLTTGKVIEQESTNIISDPPDGDQARLRRRRTPPEAHGKLTGQSKQP